MKYMSIPKILDLYARIFLLLVCLTIGIAFIFAGAKTALAATVKPVSILDNNVLTVGDVFDGLSAEKANYVLGPAPRPGQDMVLNARTLMRIALALDLPWQPAHAAEQVVVRRSSTVIHTNDISERIKSALVENGIEGRYDIAYDGLPPEIILPQDTPASFELSDFEYDNNTGFFKAVLLAPTAQNPIQKNPVSGKASLLVKVPVLNTPLRNGDIIGDADITMIDMQSADLQHDYILTAEQLIGMTPRRIVDAGKAIRDVQLTPPQIVSRGETVTIIYKTGPMTLTAQGKALQNGAKGDNIRIINTTSNSPVEGFITAAREVTVK